jgi:hypothetical protein
MELPHSSLCASVTYCFLLDSSCWFPNLSDEFCRLLSISSFVLIYSSTCTFTVYAIKLSSVTATFINYHRGNFYAFWCTSMGFPRGGFYSSPTEPGSTIVHTQPIIPFDSWIQTSHPFNKRVLPQFECFLHVSILQYLMKLHQWAPRT